MGDTDKNQGRCAICCIKYNPTPIRYVMALMGCLATVNAYFMRQCLSLTITQLVVPRNYTIKQIKEQLVCEADKDISKGRANSGTHDWNQFIQAFILSSFYLGYVATHIPSGILACKYGLKWVLGLGIFSTAVFTILTPVSIEVGGAAALILLRTLLGAGEGTIFPALAVLLADWIPPEERGTLGSLVMGGGLIGSLISNSITGWMLTEYHWSVVFYVWGIVAILWFAWFIVLCYNSPLTHPCIKESERNMLRDEIGETSNKRKDLPSPPYKKIIQSSEMWALISAQIGHDWAFYVLLTYLPKYMNDVQQMAVYRNGILSALPSAVMWVCSLIFGIFADILIRTGCMTTSNVRKLMTGIAAFGPAIFLIAASYSGCNRMAVIINFCIAMGLMGGFYGGMKLTPIDMSPNYAGVLMAITNGISSLTGFLAPITVGLMTPNTTLNEYRNVFWVALIVLIVTSLHYCIYAKSEVQPWNEPDK